MFPQQPDIKYDRKSFGPIGSVMSALAMAPAAYQQNKMAGQQSALDMDVKRTQLEQALSGIKLNDAKTNETNQKTALAKTLQEFQASPDRGGDMTNILSHQTQTPVSLPPQPGVGNTETAPLGMQVAGMDRYGPAMANYVRAYPDQFHNIQQGLQTAQQSTATGQATQQLGQGNYGQAAALSQIGAGKGMAVPYTQNAQGSVLQGYTGGVDQNNPLAQSNVQQNQAQASNSAALAGLNQRKLEGYDTDIQGMLPEIGPNGEVYYRTNTDVQQAGVSVAPPSSKMSDGAQVRDMLASTGVDSLSQLEGMLGTSGGSFLDRVNMATVDSAGAGAVLSNAMMNLIYIKTGKAATEQEFAIAEQQYKPNLLQGEEASKVKLELLKRDLLAAMANPHPSLGGPMLPGVQQPMAQQPMQQSMQQQDFTSQPIDQSVYTSLPPGTQYMAPDGSLRIKQ